MESKLSYESKVFKDLSLPNRNDVIHVLLTSLLKHNGYVKEFGSGNQTFVNELADLLALSNQQRSFLMETIVKKEGRRKTFPAWHRLLFRAADVASRQKLLSHPKDTFKLTGKREWMLTEKGIDEALRLSKIPLIRKQELPIITYEVQQVKNALEKAERIKNYNPVDISKKTKKTTKELLLRNRGFRQAIIQAYDYRCCICGLKINSPDSLVWEVEAAHIVPHRFHGKDDIWNGIALCHFHHWLFDVGWFTLRNNFTIEVSERIRKIPTDHGFMGSFDILRQSLKSNQPIRLPDKSTIYPHENSLSWHRNNIFTQTTK
jgi:hypothetical protein